MANRRRLFTAYGKTLSVYDWVHEPECLSTNNPMTLMQRFMKNGRTPEEALAPEPSKAMFITVDGVTKKAQEWGEGDEYEPSFVTILSRIKRGVDPVEAVTLPTKSKPREKPKERVFFPKKYLVNGKMLMVSEAVNEPNCEVGYSVVYERSRKINPGDELYIGPTLSKSEIFSHNGKHLSLIDWVKEPEVKPSYSALHSRIYYYGYPFEKAIAQKQIFSSSIQETQLKEFLESLGLAFREHARDIIHPYEIDLVVDELKIGIEHNGLFWHSSAKKDADYHALKHRLAKEAGWTLIQIWGDEWELKQDIVKQMLKSKLGVDDRPRIYARKTKVDMNVSSTEAGSFLESNHIQGSAGGSVRIGLRDDRGQLVALSLFRKKSDSWDLTRYATSALVPGGFTKILSAFTSNHSGDVETFADLCVSDGELYRATGFVEVDRLEPDYKYLINGNTERSHKFNFRKKRFKDDPDLLWEEGLTETQLAQLNKILRVYDAGKIKFVYKNS